MVHRRRVLAPTATAAAAIWCGGGVSGFVVPAGLSSVHRLASGSDGTVARIHAVQMDAKSFPENLVIVGSGPAGFTAAIYAGRANMKPFMFEGASETGGQLMATTEVENFPGFPDGILGPDLMANMRRQAVRWNCEIETDDVTGVDLSKRPFTLIASSGKTVEANSVIVATGAKAKRLNLPSERKYWSKGITACAICDGAAPLFRDEPLGVVGGGDSALEEAVYLTKYSPEIHVFVRSDKLRASAAMQDRARANRKIQIHLNTVIEDVYGDDADKPFTKSPLRGVRVRTDGGIREVPIRGLFYAIGHEPNTKVFQDLELDEMGYIKVKPGSVQTSVEGVFAAGDVHDPHWRQAVTAAGSGCMAALSAERYLSEKGLLREIRRTAPDEKNIPVKPSTSSEAPLPVMGMVSGVAAGEDLFDLDSTYHSGELAFARLNDESPKPILVMFMSKTCGPCRILKPILSRVLKDFEGQLHFVEIDIEEYPDLTLRSGIAGTPTVQVYKGSELKTTLRGVKKMADYRREIEDALESSSRA